jgi:glyoxylase-like metal-dependent hydrolase (beta-lactamase superfamily II)
MGPLWGEFLPVPEERLSVLQDNEEVEVFDLRLRTLNTPGHASHHYAYILEDICFSGDIGGIRIANQRHLRPPMVPPEFDLEQWRASLDRLHRESFTRIAPTHFGLYSDPDWHLAALEKALDQVEAWMQAVLPADPSLETVSNDFQNWIVRCAQSEGVPPEIQTVYETAIPSWMSAQGIYRYWHKFRKH